jgi:hypothetical protein
VQYGVAIVKDVLFADAARCAVLAAGWCVMLGKLF